MQPLAVELSFEIGEAAVPQEAWASLRPGYIAFVDGRPNAPVRIKTGGDVVGRGELVAVDGRLGVRFVEVVDHGIG